MTNEQHITRNRIVSCQIWEEGKPQLQSLMLLGSYSRLDCVNGNEIGDGGAAWKNVINRFRSNEASTVVTIASQPALRTDITKSNFLKPKNFEVGYNKQVNIRHQQNSTR